MSDRKLEVVSVEDFAKLGREYFVRNGSWDSLSPQGKRFRLNAASEFFERYVVIRRPQLKLREECTMCQGSGIMTVSGIPGGTSQQPCNYCTTDTEPRFMTFKSANWR